MTFLCVYMELPSSSWRSLPCRRSREKLLWRIIWPAVQGQSCPVCLEDLDVPSSVVLTPCKHAYCAECMHRWSRLRRKCPLCNADFDSWFSHINLSSGNFHKQRLPALSNSSNRIGFDEQHPQRSDFLFLFNYILFFPKIAIFELNSCFLFSFSFFLLNTL